MKPVADVASRLSQWWTLHKGVAVGLVSGGFRLTLASFWSGASDVGRCHFRRLYRSIFSHRLEGPNSLLDALEEVLEIERRFSFIFVFLIFLPKLLLHVRQPAF